MTGNAEDASDMTQEAFIKAYNSLQSFRGDSKFSVWLYRIVSNVCLDFLRKQKRRPTVSLSVEDDEGSNIPLYVGIGVGGLVVVGIAAFLPLRRRA